MFFFKLENTTWTSSLSIAFSLWLNVLSIKSLPFVSKLWLFSLLYVFSLFSSPSSCITTMCWSRSQRTSLFQLPSPAASTWYRIRSWRRICRMHPSSVSVFWRFWKMSLWIRQLMKRVWSPCSFSTVLARNNEFLYFYLHLNQDSISIFQKYVIDKIKYAFLFPLATL